MFFCQSIYFTCVVYFAVFVFLVCQDNLKKNWVSSIQISSPRCLRCCVCADQIFHYSVSSPACNRVDQIHVQIVLDSQHSHSMQQYPNNYLSSHLLAAASRSLGVLLWHLTCTQMSVPLWYVRVTPAPTCQSGVALHSYDHVVVLLHFVEDR